MNVEEMKNRIIDFGIPQIEVLQNKKLKLAFSYEEVPGTEKMNYHCRVDDVKFCLYDIENQVIIFTMEFFAGSSVLMELTNEEAHVKLELLYVNDRTLRNKGIASYYIKQLQEYAIERGSKFIKVFPNPNAENFKGNKGMPMSELIKFYKNLSGSVKKIVLIG